MPMIAIFSGATLRESDMAESLGGRDVAAHVKGQGEGPTATGPAVGRGKRDAVRTGQPAGLRHAWR
ncbi:hypothetical protein ACE1SV_57600 [Streptomyces sennicomposti]